MLWKKHNPRNLPRLLANIINNITEQQKELFLPIFSLVMKSMIMEKTFNFRFFPKNSIIFSNISYNFLMVFRLTKKASEQTHISVTNEGQSQNRYCDWFVDLFVGKDKKKYFLITNSFSLFSIVISAKGIRGEEVFSKNVLNQLRIYFEKTGHSDLFSQFIQPFENEIIFTKTNSRSVLKSMEGLRERAVFETVFIQAEDEQEKFFKINNHINKVPCKCANTGVGDYSFGYEQISSDLMKLPAVFEESNVRQKSPKTVFQFYAELENYNPKIYRRFIISPDFTYLCIEQIIST